MAYYPKKPRVTELEVIKQIEDRTGIPVEGIKKIVNAYSDIVKEALLSGVEVPFGEICYFSWKQINARPDVCTWNPYTCCYTEPHDIPGFRKMVVRVNQNWGREFKAVTLFNLGEKNPMEYEYEEEKEDSDGV